MGFEPCERQDEIQKAAYLSHSGRDEHRGHTARGCAARFLYMVFQQALEDGLIQRNPLHSKSVRITGRGSKPTEPYSVAQMRFLAQHIGLIENPSDRAYMALQALHPLRLEEVLGLKWMDIDALGQVINVRRAVTHP